MTFFGVVVSLAESPELGRMADWFRRLTSCVDGLYTLCPVCARQYKSMVCETATNLVWSRKATSSLEWLRWSMVRVSG
jgi:hypothetical protein